MPSHEAGWAHADGALKGPSWLREPTDTNRLVPALWSRTAHKRDGAATSWSGAWRWPTSPPST